MYCLGGYIKELNKVLYGTLLYFIVDKTFFSKNMYLLLLFFFAEYFATLGTVWRNQFSQPPFAPQLSRNPSYCFKNLPSVVLRLRALPDHHSGEEYTQKGVLHHLCQSMGLRRRVLLCIVNFILHYSGVSTQPWANIS